jgi:hypothetical protein
MIKRGSKLAGHAQSTPDDSLWLKRFELAHSQETRGRGHTATLGFFPGLWRAINNKSAFAENIAAASLPGSCDFSAGACAASYHPETSVHHSPSRSCLLVKCARVWHERDAGTCCQRAWSRRWPRCSPTQRQVRLCSCFCTLIESNNPSPATDIFSRCFNSLDNQTESRSCFLRPISPQLRLLI